MKTNELTGAALDWAVAMAEGDKVFRPRLGRPTNWSREAYDRGEDDRWVVRVQSPTEARFVDWVYNPSVSWWQGGPIIERFGVGVYQYRGAWAAHCPLPNGGLHACMENQPTPLIAAMRCYVASKLGEEVDIPKELQP